MLKLFLHLLLILSIVMVSCAPFETPPQKTTPGENTVPLPGAIVKEIPKVTIAKPIILSAKETSPGTWVVKLKNIKSGKVRLVIGYMEWDAQVTGSTVTINTGWQPPYQANGYRVTAGVIQNSHYAVSICIAGQKQKIEKENKQDACSRLENEED